MENLGWINDGGDDDNNGISWSRSLPCWLFLLFVKRQPIQKYLGRGKSEFIFCNSALVRGSDCWDGKSSKFEAKSHLSTFQFTTYLKTLAKSPNLFEPLDVNLKAYRRRRLENENYVNVRGYWFHTVTIA